MRPWFCTMAWFTPELCPAGSGGVGEGKHLFRLEGLQGGHSSAGSPGRGGKDEGNEWINEGAAGYFSQ